jgi:signal transduction histidine kinase/CheY-like chemotaxis protein
MLEGFDKQWHYVGHDHKATYTNLPLGTYTFRVRATNNDGVWSDHEARLKVVVHPPLWWSLPARIAYVVLAVLLLWLALRLFLGRAERRHKKEMALLNETKEEEARNARMEFFTTIAHEIRTPVSLIIGPLEQLKSLQWNDVKNITPALSTLNSQLKVIDRNAHRLLELVNLLLDFRKVEQGRQKVQMAVLKVAPLLQAVADNFEPSVRQKGMDFKLTLPDERLTVVADREALVKLLSNLLSNAVKYTHDRVELACQVEADGHHYSISVSDNGRGISESDMRHVFDPFFQAKGSKPGTGIGLSIVKSIAQAHGGQVSVSSQVGQGTTFRVVLPISQEVANEIETASSPRIAGATGNTGQSSATGKSGSEGESGATAAPGAPAPVEKPTLLVVDDNEEMLTFLVTTFMDHYEVLPAHDGTEALKLLEESLVAKDGTPTSTISVVVSDWMMQQMDGPELCSRMRQNHATRHIPFVLLTAKTDSLSKVQAMEAGVDAFIEKPFPVKYLEACISNLLRRFKT